jgi:hypothetical protein
VNASAILSWLERFGRRVEFQKLSPSRRRRKNRVLLQFASASDEVQVVGGPTLAAAVSKAATRAAYGADSCKARTHGEDSVHTSEVVR